jgi:nucleoside-diphosphate-sugar epimerase/predicted dehydrogenase
MARVCLVGAGVISRVHAEALRGHAIAAVVDPDAAAAQRLAGPFGAATHASVAEALAAGGFDRAHVLVPPPLHAATAAPLLEAGISVLLEKPLAASVAQANALLDAAARGGAILGVNQNFVRHPAFARLRALIDARAYGPPRFLSLVYNVPLRQLAARQFGHWMFSTPQNLLLEQAVHPLSQIFSLSGPIADLRVLADPATEIAPGVPFIRSLTVSLLGAKIPAEMRFAVGAEFPFWQVSALCDDGVIVADILNNRLAVHGRTRWLEPVDALLSGFRTAGALARGSLGNAARYVASTAKLRSRSDAFFLSMQASIAAFHAAVDNHRAPETDGQFGKDLVELCEKIAEELPKRSEPRPEPRPPLQETGPAAPAPHLAILGGTGFIGTALVKRALDANLAVSILARSTSNLPAIFADPRITLHKGDIRDAAVVQAAIAGCATVINLAHGGGGANFEAVRAAMLGGAETVANACLAAGTQRLIHIGSIAALYLGPGQPPVTGATPPDPREQERADYARAKAATDRMLLRMHADKKLPVVILRPGVVVGAGTSPFHSGLGFFNTEQHCIGWNAGKNPLPFVLVDDVAAAILAAVMAPGIDGRCYNLVGDVRPTARAYILDLARALHRPLRFHPQSPTWLWLEDMGKWLVKRATGRAVPMPSRRDFLSRGMAASFDCADAKRDLNWQPTADAEKFRRDAIAVHAGS